MNDNHDVAIGKSADEACALKGITSFREAADPVAGLDSQLLFGEKFHVVNRVGDWYSCVVDFAGFKRHGYIHASEVAFNPPPPSHQVVVEWTPLLSMQYSKALVVDKLPKGSSVTVIDETKFHYVVWPRGFIYKEHLTTVGHTDSNLLQAYKSLVGTPFVWGGRSVFGVDCAGFIQLGMLLVGLPCPRHRTNLPLFFDHAPGAADPEPGDVLVVPKHCAVFVERDRVLNSSARFGHVVDESLSDFQAYLRGEGYETEFIHLRPNLESIRAQFAT